MKAEELMLGDYVRVIPSGLTIQIAAIHNKKVAYHAVKTKLEWVRLDMVEPIPVTSDILEKNGWYQLDKEERSELWVFVPVDNPVEAHYYYTDTHVFGMSRLPHIARFDAPYLHQFQHLSKLCGINSDVCNYLTLYTDNNGKRKV